MKKLFTSFLATTFLSASFLSNAQIINPQQPTTAGTGLTKSGTVLSVNYGTTSSTAIQGSLYGASNGVATLDGSGKLTASQIPASLVGSVNYQGAWNATTNSPTLTSSSCTKGYYYVVSVAGSTNLDGITSWGVGDVAICNGSVWQYIQGQANPVISVFGQTGVVPNLSGDLSTSSSSVTTLAAVNSNVGSFGPTTQSPSFTVNAKGLITAASNNSIAFPVTSVNSQTGAVSLSLASSDFANQGTTTTVLHGNAAGNPSFGSVSLTADVSGILGSANGGTANGFTKFSGPATSEKTFTLPNASATVLTDNAAVTVAQGGTGATSLNANNVLLGNGTSAVQTVAPGTSGNVLTSNGTTWASSAPSTGALTLVSSTTCNSGTTCNFLNSFTSSNDNYLVILEGISPDTVDMLRLRVATGGSLDTGSNYIYTASEINTSTGVELYDSSTGGTFLPLSLNNFPTANTNGASYQIQFINTNLNGTGRSVANVSGYYVNNSGTAATSTSRTLMYGNAALTGFGLYWSGGGTTFDQGVVKIYKYAN